MAARDLLLSSKQMQVRSETHQQCRAPTCFNRVAVGPTVKFITTVATHPGPITETPTRRTIIKDPINSNTHRFLQVQPTTTLAGQDGRLSRCRIQPSSRHPLLKKHQTLRLCQCQPFVFSFHFSCENVHEILKLEASEIHWTPFETCEIIDETYTF